MSTKQLILAVMCVPMLTAVSNAGQQAVQEILQSYADDYRYDPTVSDPITFGIRIAGDGGGDWRVVVGGRKKGDVKSEVTIEKEAEAEKGTLLIKT